MIDTVEKEGFRKEHFSFQSTRGERIFANFYSATGPSVAKEPKRIIWVEGGHGATSDESETELRKWMERYAR